jgi:hypothetical protein
VSENPAQKITAGAALAADDDAVEGKRRSPAMRAPSEKNVTACMRRTIPRRGAIRLTATENIA